jgi:hypothetical protein
VGDLRDVLVLFYGAVLGDAGLPGAGGEERDGLLVGYLELSCQLRL